MNTGPQVSLRRDGTECRVCVGGSWDISQPWPPEAGDALRAADGGCGRLLLTADDLRQWDSSLLVFLVRLVCLARAKQVEVVDNLPPGLGRLLQLAFAVPPKAGAQRSTREAGLLERLGGSVLSVPVSVGDFLEFLGDAALSFGRFLLGRSHMRAQDFLAAMYECGVCALPIISITSLLFGLILAFVGAVQLQQFGAQLYVAGLVGIGMLRVMGAVMVGVVMSGRMGASYAAVIGTMQVNEEVDALSTTGLSPTDFLVLPRMLALALMTPLLTVYADLMGILGGFLVGVTMLDLNALEYLNATATMVNFRHGLIGLVYGAVFGVIIALFGCYHGMRCGRSALAVGRATTTAVVHSLVGIIVATAIITIICNLLRI